MDISALALSAEALGWWGTVMSDAPMEWARGMKQPHREIAEKQIKTNAKAAFTLFI
jgi:hypothetical protein